MLEDVKYRNSIKNRKFRIVWLQRSKGLLQGVRGKGHVDNSKVWMGHGLNKSSPGLFTKLGVPEAYAPFHSHNPQPTKRFFEPPNTV